MITTRELLSELSKPAEIAKFKGATASIQVVDAREQKWQMTLPELMNKFGFKLLGAGKYASVYGNDKYPYVIKVFMRDTAYLKWLAFAKQNQNNPWVPKIRGKVVRIGPTFMAVRLERLETGGKSSDLYDADARGEHDAVTVANFLESNAKLLDLHDGNVMKRGNQTVIVDPFYNFYRGGTFSIDPDDLSHYRDIITGK